MTKAKHKFEIGDLVFAKVRGYPHWPARVSPTDGHNVHVPKGKYFIIFYGTYETAVLNDRDLVAYNENSHSKYGNCKKPGFMNGMDELVNDPDITLRLRHGDESQVSENETVESELDQDVRASDSNKESSEQKIDLAPKDESLKQSTSDPDSSTAEKETDSPTIPDINSKSAIIKFEDVDVSQNENNDLPAVKSEEELSSEDEEIIVKKRRDGSIIKNSVQKDHLSKKKKLPSSESHDKRIKPRSKKPRTSISSTPVVQNKKKRAQSPLSSIGTVSEDEIYPTKSVLTKQQKPVRVSRSHEEQSCENTEVKRQNEQNKNPSHEVKRPEVQLQHLHLELMKSLSVKSTDHSKALSTMQAIDKLLIAETLKQSPDVVNTLRKVRKYQKDEAIRLKANQLYNKIKSLFLFSTSQDFIKDFMKSVELYRNEKDLKAREMKDVDKNTSQLLDEIKKTEETDSVSVQTVDPNNDIDAILVETTQQNELPGSETKVFEDQDTDNSLLLNSTSQKVKYWWEANGQNASDSHSSENESENSPAVPTALEESIKAPEKENVEEKGKPESELEIDWIDSVLGI